MNCFPSYDMYPVVAEIGLTKQSNIRNKGEYRNQLMLFFEITYKMASCR